MRIKEMKLREIAELVKGKIIGPAEIGDLQITGVSGIYDAKEGDITYLSNVKLMNDLKKSRASVVIASEYIEDIDKPQLITDNPQYAFAVLLKLFYTRPNPFKGVSEKAYIADNVKIGDEVTIYPFSYLSEGVEIGRGSVIHSGVFIGENTKISENCLIYPNVVIREGVFIGKGVIIHAGAVIGSDGFGYVYHNGKHNKIPQVGGVIIEDDVEIGACTTIDRATTGNTIVGKGTKIDNLVQIGHNVRIGRNVIIVSQVGIGGSSIINDGVIIGGQVGISDHATVEAGTQIGAKSGIMGTIKKGIYSGSPAIPHREWLKASALFSRLPEINRRINELENQIEQLRSKIKDT